MPVRAEYARPDRSECASFHLGYVREVPEGDILQTLERQLHATTALLEGLTPAQAEHAYAPGKWTVKDVLSHVIDAERIFSYRALRIARGDATPLPGFDEKTYVPLAGARDRSLVDLLAEFHAVRRATLALFDHLPADAATRRGTAAGAEVSVRALAWVITGHELHHQRILRERYLA
ncbi:MAG: DinB family protein [Gemmatimonadales bacterium]